MRNKILFDHFIITVSEKEFSEWQKKSKSNENINYKKVDTGTKKWEGIYVSYKSGIYIEILRDEKNKNSFGLALSSHGREDNLLKDLKESYPNWEITSETTYFNKEPWFLGIYSDQSESKATFVWFMEFLGKFRKEREINTNSRKFLDQDLVINILMSESIDMKSIFKNVPIEIEDNPNGFRVFDDNNEHISFVIDNSFKSRVEFKKLNSGPPHQKWTVFLV